VTLGPTVMFSRAAVAGVIFVFALPAIADAQSAATTFQAPAVAVDPTPAPTTGNPSPRSSSSPANSLAPLGQNQANGLFDGFLTHGFESATNGIRDGLKKLVDDANLVTNTAPTWTYQQPTVNKLQGAVLVVTNAAIGLVIVWMGFNILFRPQLGEGYPDLQEALPRLILGAGLANATAWWSKLAIDANNSVCAYLFTADSGTLGDLILRIPLFDHVWLTALLLVAFLLVWIWLFIKMAYRMAMLQLLLVLAPAAQLCWVLPQTRGMADRWHGKFWSTLFAQVVITVALKLAWGFAGAAGDGPIGQLITIFLLLLAANSSELLAGGASRFGLMSLIQTALLLRSLPAPAAAGARGAVGAASSAGASPVPAAAAAAHTTSSPGWAGSATNKGGFGRGGRAAVSPQAHGTGAGVAVSDKAQQFVRGGRASRA